MMTFAIRDPATTQVPEGMSCVNALRALYLGEEKINQIVGKDEPLNVENVAKKLDFVDMTSESLAAQIHKFGNGKVDYLNGIAIKADFSKFPEICVTKYNEPDYHGAGAAERALAAYARIAPENRLDQNDTHNFNSLQGRVVEVKHDETMVFNGVTVAGAVVVFAFALFASSYF
ncbi:MAG: hypothetical protein ChlgKO_10670 [Chlamydiales bacterium]